jgi:hypothetical protein
MSVHHDDQLEAAAAEVRLMSERLGADAASQQVAVWLSWAFQASLQEVVECAPVDVCAHISASPSPAVWLLRDAGTLRCPECAATLVAASENDYVCDRCGRPSETTSSVQAPHGPFLVVGGICAGCVSELDKVAV